MNFRLLTSADLPVVMALVNSIEQSPAWIPGDSTYEKHMTECGLNFGAFENQTLVAKVGFTPLKDDEFEVNNMIVDKKYQHQGIGKQLFSYALNELVNTKHPKKVVIFTYPKNAGAISLYQQFGFFIKENIPNKYGPDMHRVRMEKIFP